MLFYHSTFKDNSSYLKLGRENHIMWSENTKNGFQDSCWTVIYCNPTINNLDELKQDSYYSYCSNYLASIHLGYHYFVFHKMSVKLLAIF